MASPDIADRENQRKTRVSWEEPEKGFKSRFPVLKRFRGSRIARRIILYNFFSLSFLLVAFLALTQTQGTAFQQKLRELNLASDLVQAQLMTSGALSSESGFEVRLFRNNAVTSLEIRPTIARQNDGILARVSQFTTFNSPISFEERRAKFDQALAEIAVRDGEYPAAFLIDAGTYENTVLVDRRNITLPDGGQAVVVLSTPLGLMDFQSQIQRERIIQAFLSALAVATGLSIILAYSIATPIHELASAAEKGRNLHGDVTIGDQIEIPKLHGRPDEIGRLSVAMRDMTKALYEQIEHNQRFAADVTHEIKNPLASVSSAVQGLTRSNTPEQRAHLEKVLMDDINRLDRLITDISQASKLDADLVRAERASFDLGKLLANIVGFHEIEAKERGVELLLKDAETQLFYMGLEQRLAQVFSNLISNAVTICQSGDRITVWNFVTRENVFVIVEDTGPGIPEENLNDIFERFYSSRAEGSFGKNSGLGLAISKQIIEGHQGQIWAENIYQDDNPNSARVGARFIVSLPRV